MWNEIECISPLREEFEKVHANCNEDDDDDDDKPTDRHRVARVTLTLQCG